MRSEGERGFALAVAMWMLAILSFLVIGHTAFVLNELAQAARLKDEVRARVLATSAIEQAVGLLIEDRPDAKVDRKGVVLTEVLFEPVVQPKIVINGGWNPTTGSSKIAVYNAGRTTADLSKFCVDDDSGAVSSKTCNDLPLSGTLGPGEAVWVDPGGNLGVSAAGVYYVFEAVGSDSVLRSAVEHPAFTDGYRWALLPDGGVDALGNDVDSHVVLVHYNTAYEEKWLNDLRFPTGSYAPTNDTNGQGLWLDSYVLRVEYGAQSSRITIPPPTNTGASYVTGGVFLRYDKAFIVVNNLPGYVTGGETTVVTRGNDTIPWIDKDADSYQFVLRDAAGNTVSQTGRLDFVAETSYHRTTDAGAMVAGGNGPGVPDGSYTSNQPIISEVSDFLGGGLDILSNGNFEGNWTDHTNSGNADSWIKRGTTSSIHHSEAASRSANHSMRLADLTTSFAGRGLQHESQPVTAGDTYHVGVWALTKFATPSQIHLRMEVQWYTAAGSLISTDVPIADSTFSAGDAWLEFRANNLTAPTNAAYASVLFWGHDQGGSTTNDDIYLDDAFLEEVQPSQKYSPKEFVEISLGRPTGGAADTNVLRRREFIEIMNVMTDTTVDLVAGQYWVSVGSATGANKRYIYPLGATPDTLAPGEVAIIVAADFMEEDSIALSVPKTTKVFGLGDATDSDQKGSDLYIGRNGTQELADAGEVVVIGADNDPANMLTSGVGFGDPGPPKGSPDSPGYSWQKIKTEVYDDTSSPYDDWEVSSNATTPPADNWKQSGGANNGDPGRANPPANPARLGVDAHETDVWFDSHGVWQEVPGQGWMRYEIFDEGAKININNANETYFAKFLTYTAEPGNTFYGTSDTPSVDALNMGTFVANWGSGNVPAWITPEHPFYAYEPASPDTKTIPKALIPWITVYGPSGDALINVNYAVLGNTGPLVAALSTAPTIDRTMAASIAGKYRAYVLGADGALGGAGTDADSYYTDASELTSESRPFAPFTGAELTALAGASIGDTLAVSSNQFFTIVGSGGVFKSAPGADTVAFRKQMAVVRRSTVADKAIYLFWRNTWADWITYYRTHNLHY